MSVEQIKRRRGVTLIEAVLYIAIALALIVGGLVFFQQASTAQKASEGVRLASSMVAEARAMYQTDKIAYNNSMRLFFPGEGATLVANGSIPAQYIGTKTVNYSGVVTYTSSVINPWGGQAEIWFSRNFSWGAAGEQLGVLYLFLQDVPVAACTRMVQSSADPTTNNVLSLESNIIGGTSYGVVIANAANNSAALPWSGMRNYSPGQAANACRYGAAYGNTIGDYTGNQPRLDRVNIMLTFPI
jgi:type II secretory pathway pseudopilin PulG